jgi:hypothetical protein
MEIVADALSPSVCCGQSATHGSAAATRAPGHPGVAWLEAVGRLVLGFALLEVDRLFRLLGFESYPPEPCENERGVRSVICFSTNCSPF